MSTEITGRRRGFAGDREYHPPISSYTTGVDSYLLYTPELATTSITEVLIGTDATNTEATVVAKYPKRKNPIAKQAELDFYAQTTIQEIKELPKVKDIIVKASDLEVLALQIFEKQNVYQVEQSLFIRFPNIHITSSRNKNGYDLKDLIIKLQIDHRAENKVLHGIKFQGMRLTMSIDEVLANYTHSHLQVGQDETFTDFCLGSSDFHIILTNTIMSPTKENWSLLLFSLENFLSWESVEGGPYINIGMITQLRRTKSINNTDLQRELNSIIHLLPCECIRIHSISVSIITNDHFRNFLDVNFKIRKLETLRVYSEREIEDFNNSFRQKLKGIKWRDDTILERSVYQIKDKEPEDNTLDYKVVESVSLYIQNILNNQSNILQTIYYEQIKQKSSFSKEIEAFI